MFNRDNIEDHFRRKLRAALDHVNNTCIIGASNKIEDLERTGGWSLFLECRYFHNGKYINSLHKDFAKVKEDLHNLSFDPEHHDLFSKNQDWYYQGRAEGEIIYFSKTTHLDPMNDPSFKVKLVTKKMLLYALLAKEGRFGNCGHRGMLLIKNLWENAAKIGIHRIEMVNMDPLDHVIVIVNRLGDDLKDRKTWGNEVWFLDSWYKKGIIFSGNEFLDKINKIKKYVITQSETLGNIVNVGAYPDNEHYLSKCIYEINPAVDKYPSYKKWKLIEDYYSVVNIYPDGIWQDLDEYQYIHKKKFKYCLNEIKRYIIWPIKDKLNIEKEWPYVKLMLNTILTKSQIRCLLNDISERESDFTTFWINLFVDIPNNIKEQLFNFLISNSKTINFILSLLVKSNNLIAIENFLALTKNIYYLTKYATYLHYNGSLFKNIMTNSTRSDVIFLVFDCSYKIDQDSCAFANTLCALFKRAYHEKDQEQQPVHQALMQIFNDSFFKDIFLSMPGESSKEWTYAKYLFIKNIISQAKAINRDNNVSTIFKFKKLLELTKNFQDNKVFLQAKCDWFNKGSFGTTDSYKSCLLQLRIEVLKILQKARKEGKNLIRQGEYDDTHPLSKQLKNLFAEALTFTPFFFTDPTRRTWKDLQNNAKQVVPPEIAVCRRYCI